MNAIHVFDHVQKAFWDDPYLFFVCQNVYGYKLSFGMTIYSGMGHILIMMTKFRNWKVLLLMKKVQVG